MSRFVKITGAVFAGTIALGIAQEACPQSITVPTCNDYGVKLQIRRMFHEKYKGSRDIMMLYAERDLANNSNSRLCSAEILVPGTITRSGHEYIEYSVKAESRGGYSVTVTHEEQL